MPVNTATHDVVSHQLFYRKLIKWFVVPSVLLLLSWLIVNWLDANKPQPTERPTRVKNFKVFVHRSEQITTPLVGYSQGQLLPRQDLELRTEITGKIDQLSDNLVNGGKVQKGELLVQIDQSDYQLQVIQRQSKVAQAEQQLATVKAQTQAAQQELADLGRKNPSELALGLPQLKQAEAALKAAQADLSIAELALSRTQILAPFNGRIEQESLTRGQYLNRGGLVAKLHANDVMEVRLAMSSEQFSQISLPLDYYTSYEHSEFTVKLSSQIGRNNYSWDAKIVRVEAAIDSQTRSIYAVAEVHTTIDEKQPLLKGLFVNAEITGRQASQVSILPKAALRSNEQLWIADSNNQLQVLTADIVQRTPDTIIVKNLPNNSLVITSALAIPTPGMPLQPLTTEGEFARKKIKPKNQTKQLEKNKLKGKKENKKVKRDNGKSQAKLARLGHTNAK
ncbi:efflux RND transporter periplasmic adaptor subunit [Paraglaciecola aquimarina]|uniref:Efflux RND transporter periplasmic adaptor subunit n=1 Tax=Paraglaciecola algarum TaxID=3050085 RepID=A0ABS9D8S0_9ALTE|nr:efflux RND transporter periplasmic adaptor subunit [Paraglaciecola sp. G1-23]MCF2949351.1 efflux RND transporter periplasmic adaptor subunit [Paraglaciecola sp. G1-23]